MTRDEIYKQISRSIVKHPVLETFEVRTSAGAEPFAKVDLCAVRGGPRFCRFDWIETSLVLPNEVVTPELVTGWMCVVSPAESFEGWSGALIVNDKTIESFSPVGMQTGAYAGPHRLDRPRLIRPGDRVSALFEGPTVTVGSIAFKLYGFEVTYSVLPDVAHFARAS